MNSPATLAAAPAPTVASSARRWIMFALLTGVAMASLDSAIANIALPTIARELGTSEAASVWVVNAFQLGTALFLLPAAALGEIRGLRVTYTFGLAAFGAASLGCALSGSLSALVLCRFLQGAGGAFVAAIGPALVRRIHGRERIGSGLALIALAVAVSGAAGPSVAAAILSVARWPWLFLVNVPICAMALWCFLRNAPGDEPQPRTFDLGGALLSAAALGLLVVGVDTLGHAVGTAVVEMIAGAIALAWLLAHQSRRQAPLVPLDLMRIPLFSLSVLTSVCSYSAQILAYVSLPFLFQSVQHRSAVETGLLITPWPLLVVVAAPLAGRLTRRYPAALLGSLGLAALAIGLACLATLPAAPSALDIAWRMALCGVGFGFFQTPNNTTLMTAGPPSARAPPAACWRWPASSAGAWARRWWPWCSRSRGRGRRSRASNSPARSPPSARSSACRGFARTPRARRAERHHTVSATAAGLAAGSAAGAGTGSGALAERISSWMNCSLATASRGNTKG